MDDIFSGGVKIKIGLDLDGVVCDYHSVLLRELNNLRGTKFKFEDITEPNFKQTGVSTEEFWDVVRSHSQSGIFRYLKPIKGAIKGANKLYEKHSIHIITHRLDRAREDAVYWLYKNKIPFDTISFTRNKGRISKMLDLDIMVDDIPRNVLNISRYKIETLLFDKPFNRKIKNTPLIKRVYNWKEILKYL